jgi:hypothetical protein
MVRGADGSTCKAILEEAVCSSSVIALQTAHYLRVQCNDAENKKVEDDDFSENDDDDRNSGQG